MKEQSLQSFLDLLASNTPTPGGGGVAALNGAMGAALVSMVCNLTIGKKKYAAVEAEMQEILQQSEALRAQLADMVAKDVAVFNKVMAAYGLPRQTDTDKQVRSDAIQAALKGATLVPLETARACAKVIALTKPVAERGNINAASDAGSAAQAALAGMNSAALNVYINLGSIKDGAFVAEKQAALEKILKNQADRVAEIYTLVKSRL